MQGNSQILNWYTIMGNHFFHKIDIKMLNEMYQIQRLAWIKIWLNAKDLGPNQLHLFQHNFAKLQWRKNYHDGVANHQPHDCLLNRLFRRRSMKTSKLRVTGLCGGNSPVTGEFPAERASYTENDSIWWRHHDISSRCHIYIMIHTSTEGVGKGWRSLLTTNYSPILYRDRFVQVVL